MLNIDAPYAKTLLPPRPENSSKATFGSVLNIAGSVNYRGAACLSSEAALRVGAGYVTLAAPSSVVNAAASRFPDAVLVPLRTRGGCIAFGEYRTTARLLTRASAVSIGSGLSSVSGGTAGVRAFFSRMMLMLSCSDLPVVIDADGINFLARLQPHVLARNAVLTPHPKELSRLLKTGVEEIQDNRVSSAARAARSCRAVIVLKGQRTIVTDGEKTFVNMTGNSALSKAGSGDVLTGVIAGLCAQGLSTLDAACLGVYIHGLAGEIAAKEKTEYGVLASDLPDYLPRAIMSLL